VARRKFDGEITIAYEPDEPGWTRARLPLCEVNTAGRSNADARGRIVDALVELFSLEPRTPAGVKTERLRIDLSLEDDLGRER
jgi:hypothetical protein